jgi:tetratricopeptide (TPR) repeat protein
LTHLQAHDKQTVVDSLAGIDLNKTLSLAQQAPDVDRNSVLLSGCEAFSKAKQFQQARAPINAIGDAHSEAKTEAVQGLAAALVQARQFDQARVAANALNDPTSKAEAFQNLAIALADVGLFRDAYQTVQEIPDTYGAKGLALVQLIKRWQERDKPAVKQP